MIRESQIQIPTKSRISFHAIFCSPFARNTCGSDVELIRHDSPRRPTASGDAFVARRWKSVVGLLILGNELPATIATIARPIPGAWPPCCCLGVPCRDTSQGPGCHDGGSRSLRIVFFRGQQKIALGGITVFLEYELETGWCFVRGSLDKSRRALGGPNNGNLAEGLETLNSGRRVPKRVLRGLRVV